MNRDYKKAYPQPPDGFRLAMERACAQIEAEPEGMARRFPKRALLVAAVIGALLIATIAIAAQRNGLLSLIFWRQKPNEQAESLVQPIGRSIARDGVTLSFDDVLVDGEDWHVSYTLSSERSDMVFCSTAWGSSKAPDRPLIDGEDEWGSMMALGGELPASQTGKLDAEAIDWRVGGRGREPFELTLLVKVMRPTKPTLLWPEDPAEMERDPHDWGDLSEAQWAEFKRQGLIPVFRTGHTEASRYMADFEVMREQGTAAAMEQAGLMETLTELRLAIAIDPSATAVPAHMRMAQPQRFELDGYALQIDAVDLAPTWSFIQFWRVPTGSDELPRDYMLLNAAGEPIAEYPLSNWDIARTWAPGKPTHYTMTAPLSDMPGALTIAPIIWDREGEGRQIAGYDMDEAVTVRLEKAVPAAKAQMIALPTIEQMGERFFGEAWPSLKPYQREAEEGVDDSGWQGYQSEPGEPGGVGDNWIDVDTSRSYVYMRKRSGVTDREATSVAGKYTTAEAVQMARDALRDVVGIDPAQLVVMQVYDQDGVERSARYEIYFGYVCDGMLLTTEEGMGLSVEVTNEGVMDINGVALTAGRL